MYLLDFFIHRIMAMFEEEAWDISPDVQQLDDGLFGGETERVSLKWKSWSVYLCVGGKR